MDPFRARIPPMAVIVLLTMGTARPERRADVPLVLQVGVLGSMAGRGGAAGTDEKHAEKPGFRGDSEGRDEALKSHHTPPVAWAAMTGAPAIRPIQRPQVAVSVAMNRETKESRGPFAAHAHTMTIGAGRQCPTLLPSLAAHRHRYDGRLGDTGAEQYNGALARQSQGVIHDPHRP